MGTLHYERRKGRIRARAARRIARPDRNQWSRGRDESGEIAKVLVGRGAVRLVTKSNPLGRRKEWLLGEGCACLKNDQEDSDAKGIHASERIALEVSRDAMKALDAYTAEVEEKTLWE